MSSNKVMFSLSILFIYLSTVCLYAQDNPQNSPVQTETNVKSENVGEESKNNEDEKKSEEEKRALEDTSKEVQKEPEVKQSDTSISGKGSSTVESKPKKEFFTGSAISFGNSFGINPDNPLSTLSMKLLPKLNLPWTEFFYISGRIDISKEVTNSDTTSYQYETQLSDGRIEFVFPELYREKFTDFVFSGLFRTSFPTSKVSQYATLRWGNMIDVGISKGFFGEKGKPDTQKLFLGYDFRFYKNWHKYTTSQTEESSGGYYKQYPLRVKAADYLNTGVTNLEYQVAHIFSGSLAITEKLSFVCYFWVINGWAYELYSGGKRGTRDSIDFNVEFGYQVMKWLSVGFGLDTFQPQLLPNSTYTHNPFWRNTYENYTTLYFDVNFVL
ncbi:MAG: hypothetical protein N2746_03255 [Deltaproteobacteria bacterium]|nr:hypothetical protein [Deltaproteobacteria bacterium]